MIKSVKKEIRILGIDDSPFKKFNKGKKVLVIGCVFRAGRWLDGVVSTYISCDGTNSTKKLISMINKTKHKNQIRVIMINGISLGGFNIIDIKELSKETKTPVIVATRRKPNFNSIKNALSHFKDWKKRWEKIEKAGKVYEAKINKSTVYYQVSEISAEKAKEIINLSATRSTVPEPLRAAHLIAGGVVLGESTGRV